MRAIPIVALALCAACSSTSGPGTSSLTGTWNATASSLPTGVRQLQLVLTQTGGAVSGTGALTNIGDGPNFQFRIVGQAGLNGSTSCFPEPSFGTCHVQFRLYAVDAAGDTLFFAGQFVNTTSLHGNVASSNALPFQNIDGEVLDFDRQ